MPSFPFSRRWLTLPVMVGLAMPVMASEHEPFIDGNLTPQSRVLALNAEESAELFDTVVDIESLGDEAFELVIESPPSFLAPLEPGWRLVAATDEPLHPLGRAERQLVNSGLLTHVKALDSDDDGTLRLSLEPAELEDVIESGTLTIVAVERVSSEEEDFPVETLLGKAIPPAGRWLPAAFQERSWEPCPPDDTALAQEKTLYFTPSASARIHYQATLALKREMTFEGGRLTEAQLEGRLCQGAEITPRFEESFKEDKPIWTRQKGPYYRMVGWVPIMLTVNTRLDAVLESSARLTTSDPFRLHHDSAGGLRLQDGDWQLQQRPSSRQPLRLPSPMPEASLDASLALEPRLELILYGSGGPYLEASAATNATWQPGRQPRSDLSLTLTGGLAYRNGLWRDDWQDTRLEPPLYRWPDDGNDDEDRSAVTAPASPAATPAPAE
ncbi:hypothetical protein [Halomonas faecis]|uniref:hypothetical protein n=1 Tax=Halomonas faecis TaxID=1562110 RepID=UPI0013D1738A|nr:hypothetical protein [Halomonas faecis]